MLLDLVLGVVSVRDLVAAHVIYKVAFNGVMPAIDTESPSGATVATESGYTWVAPTTIKLPCSFGSIFIPVTANEAVPLSQVTVVL